mgnify:CR=1 FL=1
MIEKLIYDIDSNFEREINAKDSVAKHCDPLMQHVINY